MKQHGYRQPRADRCVYVKKNAVGTIVAAVTIDDFGIATTNRSLYQQLRADLASKYKVKDLGQAKKIIGWTLHGDSDTGAIHISQPNLAGAIVRLLHMENCNPCKTPYVSGLPLHAARANEDILDTAKYPYATAVGMLRYLIDFTCPDLAYIGGMLARYMSRQHPATLAST